MSSQTLGVRQRRLSRRRLAGALGIGGLYLWALLSGIGDFQRDDPGVGLVNLALGIAFAWAATLLLRGLRAGDPAPDGPAAAAGIALGVRRAAPLFAGQAACQRPLEGFALSDEEIAHHVLLLGATGSGKTTSLLRLAEGAIDRGLGFVAVDLKGSPDVPTQLAAIAGAAGRPLFCWSLDGPDGWNPLARGDVSELKDKLIGMESWSEPHYKRAAERYLQTVFSVLATRDETASLGRVAELMRPAALNTTLRTVPPHLAERVAGYLAEVDQSRDQRSAIQGLATRLGLLAESSAGPYLETTEQGRCFDLLDCVNDGAVVVFSLDSLRYGELAAQLGGLVVQDIKTVASALLKTGGRRRVLVGIDELSALDGDQLLGLLSRAREAGMAVLLSTQELADLARVDPLFADQVLANTNVKIVHRQDVPESAERLAGVLGTYQAWEHTYIERDPLLSLLSGGVSPVTGTRRLVDKYIVHPNLFKTLRCGQAIIIRKHPSPEVDTVTVTAPTTKDRAALNSPRMIEYCRRPPQPRDEP